MKHLSLANRHRPRLFSEVIGQDPVCAALSRAAAEDRPAPAYLFSGTRGVGKTTIARIFAKALNCQAAPAPEPCNVCAQCAHIAAGNHVDVSEIDGASNTGVDDVRALREKIGYMPMEGRYKIFIVDEAHMLSKSAFNALLKTLEEPPDHTVFIFATTEAHRFPPTIISRCQHFVFRHLGTETIHAHLASIVARENLTHEDGALRLIARRAAGSARDALSLLDQVIAIGGGNLTEKTARAALGVAGREFFGELFTALGARSCGKVVDLCEHLLQSGVDIGFFMRELAANLRNLFLFRQMDGKMPPALDLGADEIAFLKEHSGAFSAAHAHAAWQLTLESQRNVARSPEPGAALELLLINLAMLPRLLPVGAMPQPTGPESGEGKQRQDVPETGNAPKKAPTAKMSVSWPPADDVAKWRVEDQVESRDTAPGAPDWEKFCDFCLRELEKGNESLPKDILHQLQFIHWDEKCLEISVPTLTLWNRVEKKRRALDAALRSYCGGNAPDVIFNRPDSPRTERGLLDEYAKRPEVALCARVLGATLTECVQK